MNKPQTYEEAFPGRFLKAALFKGQKVTLTVSDVFTEALDGDDEEGDSKPPKLVLAFAGKKMQLVVPKTNAFCIKEMFGNKLADWVGKRITFFPTTTKFGPATVECIRVWGSPDITGDMPVTVPQGRKKPLKMTMHAVKAGAKSAPAQAPKQDADPAVIEAWGVLGWTPEECEQNRAEFKGTDYAGFLSTLIDEMNAREGSGL